MNKEQLTSSDGAGNGVYINNNDQYPDFEKLVNEYFNLMINKRNKLFTTKCEGLFDTYLENLPQEARQHYNCSTCRKFINKYGGLVTISDMGEIESAIWNDSDVPEFFVSSVKAMKNMVLKSKVNGVFLSKNQTLGQAIAGGWNHLSVTLPSQMVYKSRLTSAGQAMAEKLEDFRILTDGLLEYPIEAVDQAVIILKTESLYRSEKCLGVAEWLKDLHIKYINMKNNENKNNIIWLAVATAPSGFCHIKSTMIGTLLDDIVAGLSFDSVSRRFAEKMHPLQYQRPQVPPTAGNVAEAEKIVKKLGIQKSFNRRFAILEELNKIWTPKEKQESLKNKGIFSHIITKKKKVQPKIDIPTITMTWRKFSETILPFAQEIEYLVKEGKYNFSAILTAVHEDAPPIFQWDREEKRNPFSWYVYVNGSDYSRWNIPTGYCKVTGICMQPSMWYDDNFHQGKSVFFILEGAKDNRGKNSGNCLFPEMLKSELRQIRSTIEAYSKNEDIEGYNEASACGIKLECNGSWDAVFKVTTNTGTATYKLDRWD
ncbi:hypothetical protein FDB28_05265 [Clostridium botulinum]|nr:hypothetical protein [Clostridium botulinum]NFS95273.1 hypothetical protein [Clostridium botulinum]